MQEIREVFIYVEDKQKTVSRRTLPVFFCARDHVTDSQIECRVLFHSRKNGRQSNVNLPLAYGGGGGAGGSREYACPSAHAQRRTRVCRFRARVGDAVARDTTVTRSGWQRGSTRKRG